MLIVLNHKMNLNITEIKRYEKLLKDYDVVVMPQTPYIGLFTGGKYHLGSQCISEYNATGGVSAEALAGMNVEYVMTGHSERRKLLNENDIVIQKKIEEIIKYKMTPIMCIGETLEEKERNKSLVVLEKQISRVFNNLKVPLNRVIIAYEPVWAIGKKMDINVNDISKTILFIKSLVKDYYGVNIKVLYGGSVDSKNIDTLMHVSGLDGFLIGNASLDVYEIMKIYERINE